MMSVCFSKCWIAPLAILLTLRTYIKLDGTKGVVIKLWTETQCHYHRNSNKTGTWFVSFEEVGFCQILYLWPHYIHSCTTSYTSITLMHSPHNTPGWLISLSLHRGTLVRLPLAYTTKSFIVHLNFSRYCNSSGKRPLKLYNVEYYTAQRWKGFDYPSNYYI